MADPPTRRRRRRKIINPHRSCRYFRAADWHALSRQVAVEQHLVVELMGAYRHAQGLIGSLDWGQDEACTPGAEDDWCDHHMQAIEAAGGEKTRHRVGPTLDQYTAQTACGQRGKDRRRSDMPISGGQSQ